MKRNMLLFMNVRIHSGDVALNSFIGVCQYERRRLSANDRIHQISNVSTIQLSTSSMQGTQSVFYICVQLTHTTGADKTSSDCQQILFVVVFFFVSHQKVRRICDIGFIGNGTIINFNAEWKKFHFRRNFLILRISKRINKYECQKYMHFKLNHISNTMV